MMLLLLTNVGHRNVTQAAFGQSFCLPHRTPFGTVRNYIYLLSIDWAFSCSRP
ncbi:hypothetical protein SAMN05443247_05445 [Bradyrhizobium erythrophlei]|nr:hypothetical protein SAMN05443247_05445 [Bradyrhizobium erythrophlei]